MKVDKDDWVYEGTRIVGRFIKHPDGLWYYVPKGVDWMYCLADLVFIGEELTKRNQPAPIKE